MREIVIVTASRAESGLLEPIMKELLKRQDEIGDVHPTWNEFHYTQPAHVFMTAWDSFVRTQVKPDIVLVPTDRPEMTHIASHCFNNGILVAHLHAGDMGSGHPDEMNRRAISCFSHIMFCNSEESRQNLIKLGEEEWRCYVVGSTAFDAIAPDESLCPSEPYDLVLLHPDPLSDCRTFGDLQDTTKAIKQERSTVVWLRPNKDNNHEVIDEFLNEAPYTTFAREFNVKIYDNLPRQQFLGLLKNCSRFIGNSSSLLYEAPHYGVKTINIGYRNRDRPAIQPRTGASKRIAEILATIPIDDELRRKKLIL